MAGFYDRLQTELKKAKDLAGLINQVKQRVSRGEESPIVTGEPGATPAPAVAAGDPTPAAIAFNRLEAMTAAEHAGVVKLTSDDMPSTEAAGTEADGDESQVDGKASDELLTPHLNVSILDLIESRDHLERQLKESEARVRALRQDVAMLRAERDNLEAQIKLNNQEIQRLTQLYTDQVMKYDQLNEDTQELRVAMRREISRLHQELETRKLKLNELNQEFSDYRAQADGMLDSYREQLRDSRANYEELKGRYEAIRRENERLVNRISNFAYELMSEISGKFNEAESAPPEQPEQEQPAPEVPGLEDVAAALDVDDPDPER